MPPLDAGQVTVQVRPIWDPTPGAALCTCLRLFACLCRCISYPTRTTETTQNPAKSGGLLLIVHRIKKKKSFQERQHSESTTCHSPSASSHMKAALLICVALCLCFDAHIHDYNTCARFELYTGFKIKACRWPLAAQRHRQPAQQLSSCNQNQNTKSSHCFHFASRSAYTEVILNSFEFAACLLLSTSCSCLLLLLDR